MRSDSIELSSEAAREAALRIIADIEKYWTNETGLLVGGGTDTSVEETLIIDDLGDFIPFFSYWGAEDICERHLRYLEQHFDELHFQEAFKYTDLLFGLMWYARIGKYAAVARSLAPRVMGRVLKDFLSGNFPHSLIGYKRAPPFERLFETTDVTFAEVFVEYARDFHDESFTARADKLIQYATGCHFFRKHALLPELISPIVPRLLLFSPYRAKAAASTMVKHNTNFGFALLERARSEGGGASRKAFETLYGGIIAHLPCSGGASDSPLSGVDRADLLASFALIDLMCDAYALFRDERHRSLAESIARYWMSLQSASTGLFPKHSDVRYSYLDNETDMAVALFKLSELTGDAAYAQSAKKALAGILAHHREEKGYTLETDTDSGTPYDGIRYKTKYLALLLKPLIYIHECGGVYKNETLRMLMKDR